MEASTPWFDGVDP